MISSPRQLALPLACILVLASGALGAPYGENVCRDLRRYATCVAWGNNLGWCDYKVEGGALTCIAAATTNGATGAAGPPGATGAPGAPGPPGESSTSTPGPPGSPGSPGSNGTDGVNGAVGSPGAPGAPGSSAPYAYSNWVAVDFSATTLSAAGLCLQVPPGWDPVTQVGTGGLCPAPPYSFKCGALADAGNPCLDDNIPANQCRDFRFYCSAGSFPVHTGYRLTDPDFNPTPNLWKTLLIQSYMAQYPEPPALPQLLGWHFKVCNIASTTVQVKKMRIYCANAANLLGPNWATISG